MVSVTQSALTKPVEWTTVIVTATMNVSCLKLVTEIVIPIVIMTTVDRMEEIASVLQAVTSSHLAMVSVKNSVLTKPVEWIAATVTVPPNVFCHKLETETVIPNATAKIVAKTEEIVNVPQVATSLHLAMVSVTSNVLTKHVEWIAETVTVPPNVFCLKLVTEIAISSATTKNVDKMEETASVLQDVISQR